MNGEIKYPSVDNIIEANKTAIKLLRATKAERHELLVSRNKIQEIVNGVKILDGSLKKKAAFLLTEINRRHFFASANKRTSFLIAADFILLNEGNVSLKKKDDVKFLIELREGRRALEEVIRWLDE